MEKIHDRNLTLIPLDLYIYKGQAKNAVAKYAPIV